MAATKAIRQPSEDFKKTASSLYSFEGGSGIESRTEDEEWEGFDTTDGSGKWLQEATDLAEVRASKRSALKAKIKEQRRQKKRVGDQPTNQIQRAFSSNPFNALDETAEEEVDGMSTASRFYD